MAKQEKEQTFEEQASAAAGGETTTAAATTAEADGRHVIINDPSNPGQTIKRVDFIKREVIEKGRQRGEVAKQLSEIQGKKVPYQIVFAATKGFKPKKPDAPSAGGEAASAGAEQAAAAE